uniref:MATH domain-containing protein n=1 Tax=Ditylenchus dipsaci TaxID=166011 RepID=A0A915E6U0_9BILA
MILCVATTIINRIEPSQARKLKLYLQDECTVQTIVVEAIRKANLGANFVCIKVEINDEDIGELLEVDAQDQVEDKAKYVIHVQPAGLLKDDSFWTYENESVLGAEEKENWDMMSVRSEQVDENVLQCVDHMKLTCISEPGLFNTPLVQTRNITTKNNSNHHANNMKSCLSATSSYTNLHTQASVSQTTMATENMEGMEGTRDGTSSITVQANIREKEDAQLQKSSAMNISRILALENTLKKMLEMVSDIRVELKNEQKKNTDMQNKITRLEIASEKQNVDNEKKEMVIAQFQGSLAENFSRFVTQKDALKRVEEMVVDLKDEFIKVEKTNISRLKGSVNSIIPRLRSTEEDIEGLKLLKKDFSSLKLEVEDLVKYKPHLPHPDYLMKHVFKCFFTPGHLHFKFNLNVIASPLGFLGNSRFCANANLQTVYNSDFVEVANTSWRVDISKYKEGDYCLPFLFNKEKSSDYYVEAECFLVNFEETGGRRQKTLEYGDLCGYYKILGFFVTWDDLFNTKNGYVDAEGNVEMKVNFWFKKRE